MVQKLVLIRGVPGSGKSTLAREQFSEFFHCEADDFFMVGGVYTFDAKFLPVAHQFCKDRAQRALMSGRDVVISNTFTRKWEMDDYIRMAEAHGAELQVIICQGRFKNVHGVPDDVVQRMLSRFEYD